MTVVRIAQFVMAGSSPAMTICAVHVRVNQFSTRHDAASRAHYRVERACRLVVATLVPAILAGLTATYQTAAGSVALTSWPKVMRLPSRSRTDISRMP